MKNISRQGHPNALWYLLWSAMLIVSAVDAIAFSAILPRKSALCFSLTIALVAGAQMWLSGRILCKRERALGAVLLGVFCMAQMVQFARAMSSAPAKRGVDFSAYYLAGKLMSETPGESLYQLPLFSDGRMNLNVEATASSEWHATAVRYQVPFAAPFIYPPFSAVLMEPLAHLSFRSAYVAWNVVTLLMVVAAVLLSLSVGGVRIDGKLALMLGVGLFSYYPLVDNLFYGQIGGVILFLFAAGVWLISRNRIWTSALCFAIATLIKLTPVLMVPVLIFHRRWKWLMAYFAWIITLLSFSIWQAGWSMHEQFLHVAMPAISCGAPVCQNSSIMAYVQELFLGHVPLSQNAPSILPPFACAVSRYVAFAVYCLTLLRFYRRRRDRLLVRDLILMALLAIVVSPISWWHYYTLGLLPFVYLWGTMQEKGNRILLILFLAVGTNIVGLTRILVFNHLAQLILAAIVPGLTIALVYGELASEQGVSANSDLIGGDMPEGLRSDGENDLKLGAAYGSPN